jgi:hypothetical protein
VVDDGSLVATAPAPDPDPTPTAAPSPGSFGPAPARMAEVLGAQLDGTVTDPQNWSEEPDSPLGFQAGSVLLDGAQVTILLEHTKQRRCGELPSTMTCDRVDGGFIWSGTFDEPASGGGTTDVRTSTAAYRRADGLLVTATAYNAASEKDNEPILDEPVLDEAALRALVQDAVWAAQ